MEYSTGILMADLSGFTALTEVHGDFAAKDIIGRYVSLAKGSLVGSATLIERAGDQLVIVSEDADDLAKTAIRLKMSTEREPYFPDIHSGLHYGHVVEEDGHFFGSTVNLTARIAARAKRNRILVSRDFVDAMSEPELFRTVPQGEIRFKNVLESKEIFELLPLFREKHIHHTDPVCHMHLGPTELDIRYEERNKTYFFCSEKCKALFEKYHAAGLRMAV